LIHKNFLRNSYRGVGLAAVAAGVFLAVYGVWLPYSFWLDELFSVAASSSTLQVMFSEFMLPDVHPPLYQLILKGWMAVFSSGETAARLLSVLFALGGLIVLWLWGRRRLSPTALTGVLGFYATNNLFIYYAQEVRAYALMLLLSTVVTLLYIEIHGHGTDSSKGMMLLWVGLGLSLTHYFGWLYYGVILVYLLTNSLRFQEFKDSLLMVLFGLAALVWPVGHFLLGGPGYKSGGNFWIASEGWDTTLSTVALALFPQINGGFARILGSEGPLLPALACMAVLGGLVLLNLVKSKPGRCRAGERTALRGVLFPWLSVVALLVVIDYFTPLSTARNYIVLLPGAAIAAGRALEEIYRKSRGGALVLLLLLVVTNLGGFAVYNNSWEGRLVTEDHQAIAAYIHGVREEDGSRVYYLKGEDDLAPAMDKVARFYLNRLSPLVADSLVGVSLEMVDGLTPPYLLYRLHSGEDMDRVLEACEVSGRETESFVPEQKGSGTFVIHVME